MLEEIGVESVEELFAAIPADLRLDRPLELPDGISETECFDDLASLAERNADADAETCFLGAGIYDHYVPAIVDAITQRSEFLTPYTPYQPEVSQGGLQVMFEFQTAISELTGLPVANASLYEGPSSVASAAYLALGATKGRKRLVVSRGLHPHSRETLRTYARGFGAEEAELARRVCIAGGERREFIDHLVLGEPIRELERPVEPQLRRDILEQILDRTDADRVDGGDAERAGLVRDRGEGLEVLDRAEEVGVLDEDRGGLLIDGGGELVEARGPVIEPDLDHLGAESPRVGRERLARVRMQAARGDELRPTLAGAERQIRGRGDR